MGGVTFDPDLLADVLGYTGPAVQTLADVKPQPISWLWKDRLPAGKIVVEDGDPSVGKSTVGVDMAARLSTGTPWPDGAECPLGDVLILSAEDGLADTIRPRLDAAGGDPRRVHALTGVNLGLDDNDQLIQRPITLADIVDIETAVRRYHARLLIVDVLVAYLPSGVDSHRDQDVRTVLSRIAALAEATNCCVLFLRHLNKAAGGNPLYRGGGSIGIVGAARSAFLAAVDPDDDTRRILAWTKSNLAPMPPSLAYRLESAPNGMARVQWLGESNATAAHLLTVPGGEEEHSERDAAVEWLQAHLDAHGGEARAGEVIKAAERDGIARVTLHRARRRAGITTSKSGLHDGWVWQSPTGTFHEDSEDSPSQKLKPTEPSVKPSPSAVSHKCLACGFPLNDVLVTAGEITHATCGGAA